MVREKENSFTTDKVTNVVVVAASEPLAKLPKKESLAQRGRGLQVHRQKE